MTKELVIVYDTPAISHAHIESVHNLAYYLKFFDRIRILYWAKETTPGIFESQEGRLIFYPYSKPYDSGYFTGLKFMIWIAKTLWQICAKTLPETKSIFMTVIPIWAGIPTLLVGKLKCKKIVLRLEAQKIEYAQIEGKLEGSSSISLFVKLLILKLIYHLTLPFYNVVIGISEGVSNEARKYGAKNIITIPIFINIGQFLSIIGEKISKTEKTPILLYVGQIKKVKGLQNLIGAANALNEESDYISKILIVGDITNPKDEKFYRELQEMSKEKGLDVGFLGWIPHEELPEIYKKADIFVLPSYTEALGMVIMEAMAVGLPVIATQTSGAKDLVEDGKTGFLVPIGNVVTLKEKIKVLLENSELRRAMGSAGRERIKKIIQQADNANKQLWQKMNL